MTADPLLELPLELLEEIPILAATKLQSTCDTAEEYNYRFILFTLHLETAKLLALFANGELTESQLRVHINV